MVGVATSDGMEQLIILGNGAYRISAEEFRQEVSKRNKRFEPIWILPMPSRKSQKFGSGTERSGRDGRV